MDSSLSADNKLAKSMSVCLTVQVNFGHLLVSHDACVVDAVRLCSS